MAVCDLPGRFLCPPVLDQLCNQAVSAPETSPNSADMGLPAGRIRILDSSRASCSRAGQIRKKAIWDLWPSSERRVRQALLGGPGVGDLRDHGFNAGDARRRSFLFWRLGLTWRSDSEGRDVLGGPVSGCGIIRRIPLARVHAIHSSQRHRLLAGRGASFCRFRRNSFGKPGGGVGGCAGRGVYWHVLLLDAAPHWNALVRYRHARVLGLGGELSVL